MRREPSSDVMTPACPPTWDARGIWCEEEGVRAGVDVPDILGVGIVEFERWSGGIGCPPDDRAS